MLRTSCSSCTEKISRVAVAVARMPGRFVGDHQVLAGRSCSLAAERVDLGGVENQCSWLPSMTR